MSSNDRSRSDQYRSDRHKKNAASAPSDSKNGPEEREPGTPAWLWARACQCFRARKIPKFTSLPEYLSALSYKIRLRYQLFCDRSLPGEHSAKKISPEKKNLYASAVGQYGKEYLSRIINKFGTEKFDYLIFVYDGTDFSEPVFSQCRFIYEKGIKWYFMKKYLPPELCCKYDYIFPWDEDIDVSSFCVEHFLYIIRKNSLEVAQPALLPGSFYSHSLVLQQPNKIGRFTDFVENMVQVFGRPAWIKYWELLDVEHNHWGWGCDDAARSICGYRRMGIVDSEPVLHTKPINTKRNIEILREARRKFYAKHPDSRPALKVSYGILK